MKKTLFTALRAMCVGAMTLAAVSCYDDTFLRNEIEGLGEDVKDLAARVDSLEKNLNDNIKAVNTLEASMATLETSLKAAIEENGAAVQAALQAELADLETALNAAVAKGDQELADALAAEKAAVETAMATLQTTLTTAMTESVENLDAAIKALEVAMGTKVTELLATMDKADGVLDGKIAELNKALEAVKTAYAAADSKLSEEVMAKIAEAIAKIAVVGVDAKGENVVLTLADGTQIEVSKPVDHEGLVTIIEDENGNKYWAVIVDGEPEQLPVAVGTDVNLQFQISEDNCLEWSTDGENWFSTGAYVNDADNSLFDFYQGSEFDYDLWEEVVDDYYTLVFGGEEYYLPVYKVDNSVVALKSGKTYFVYGETKTVDVVLNDVTSTYVMSKPEGWRAKLEGKTLTVTAPDSVKVATGYAEADGEVLLHCTTVEGACKIARLAVATTPGFSIAVAEDGTVVITNPNVMSGVDRWGEEYCSFQDAYIGLAPVAEFEADPAKYIENAPYDYDNVTFMLEVWKGNTMNWETGEYTIGGAYVEGEYEVDVINTSVADIYGYYNYGDEVPAGSRFVVWACPVDENGAPDMDAIVYGYYSAPVIGTIEESEVSFNDVEFSVVVDGASTFYVGLLMEEYMYGMPVDSYMQNQEGPFGSFQSALQWGMPEYAFSNMGTLYENEGEAITVTASELNYGSPLLPETKFYVWVFPVVDGLALEDYTYEDNFKPYIYSFATSGIAEGGSAVATFGEAELGYTSIAVPVTAEDAALVYYNFYDADEYNEVEDIVADLLEYGYVTAETDFVARANDLSQNTTRVLAAVVVDEDGLYGEVVEETYTTPTLEYSKTFVATVGEATLSEYTMYGQTNYKVTIPVTVTGGEAAKYYYYWGTSARTAEQLATLPLQDFYNYYEATTLPELIFSGYYESYQFAVVVESTTGELSEPVAVTVNKPAAEETPAE